MHWLPFVRDNVGNPFLDDWRQPADGPAGYPADFTRHVVPVPVHSHNDYLRRVPLYQAIYCGCTGVEADVWLWDDDLFVGHTTRSLTPHRTFRSLYVDPLLDMLDRRNAGNETSAGVFDRDPGQTLVLVVDFKTDGRATWPFVVDQLAPLRDRGYLSYFDGDAVVRRPVTVVATGQRAF